MARFLALASQSQSSSIEKVALLQMDKLNICRYQKRLQHQASFVTSADNWALNACSNINLIINLEVLKVLGFERS